MKTFAQNALLMTVSTVAVRAAGFLFRLLLANKLTAGQLGQYQLVMPLLGVISAVCTGGIPEAVARITATGGGIPSKRLIKNACLLGLSLCLPVSLLLFFAARPLALYVYGVPETEALIRALAPLPPVLAVSAVYYGACLGQENALPPALGALAEQAARLGATVLIWLLLGRDATARFGAAAYLCMSIGQAVNLAILRHQVLKTGTDGRLYPSLRQFGREAVPLTANQLLAAVLRWANEWLLPHLLAAGGIGHAQALAQYGIFCGMAMPLVTVPLSLLAPAMRLLVPNLAADLAKDRAGMARARAGHVIRLSLSLASLAAVVLFVAAEPISILLYRRPEAAMYLRTATPLLPLMALSAPMQSLLIATGKPVRVLVMRTLADLGCMAACAVLIPRFGWYGYAAAHFLQLAATLIWAQHSLKKQAFSLAAVTETAKAYACCLCSCSLGLLLPAPSPLRAAAATILQLLLLRCVRLLRREDSHRLTTLSPFGRKRRDQRGASVS